MQRTSPLAADNTRFFPQLSLAERDRRWAALRQRMAAEGLDCLVFWGNDLRDLGMVNVRYVTHIGSALGGYALFLPDAEPVIWNGLPHQNRPTNWALSIQRWVQDVRINRGIGEVVQALQERDLERGRIGVVGYGNTIFGSNITYHDYTELQRSLPGAQFVMAGPILEELRRVKSEEEIVLLQRAGEVARRAVEAMIAGSRPGRRECDVWADMVYTQVANGCEPQPLFNLLVSGPVETREPGLRHLLHGIEQPGAPSLRTLEVGDVVMSEFHTNYGGYLAATEFTVALGEPPAQLRRIHEVAVECLLAGVEKMRPGVTCRELWEAIRRPCQRAGMDFVELGFHGHGLSSPEFPTVVYPHGTRPYEMSGTGYEDFELQENMVFGQNIDIFDPNWKPDVGVMLGDMVLVTREGGKLFERIPLELPVVK